MVTGDPLWAVLIPPRLIRFRELVQIGDEQLDVNFTGWNKQVDDCFDEVRKATNTSIGIVNYYVGEE